LNFLGIKLFEASLGLVVHGDLSFAVVKIDFRNLVPVIFSHHR
jgi:hypothetical protein